MPVLLTHYNKFPQVATGPEVLQLNHDPMMTLAYCTARSPMNEENVKMSFEGQNV